MLHCPDEFTTMLDQLVDQTLEQAAVERPPVDAFAAADSLGLQVFVDPNQRGRGRIVTLPSGSTIFLAPAPRPERHQWALAHEIGEYLLEQSPVSDDLDGCFEDPSLREELANRFATLLLVPSQWWEFDARMAGYDLLQLKTIYPNVSHELLALRLLDLDPPSMISIFDKGRLVRRVGNCCSQPPPLQRLERRAQSHAHQYAEQIELSDMSYRVWAWPIHQDGWKREVVRTLVIDESPWD